MWDNPCVMLLESVSWLVHMCYVNQQRGANERRAGSAAGTYSLLRAWLWAIQLWHSHAHSHCRSAWGSRYWGGAPSRYKHTHAHIHTHAHAHTQTCTHAHIQTVWRLKKPFEETKETYMKTKEFGMVWKDTYMKTSKIQVRANETYMRTKETHV